MKFVLPVIACLIGGASAFTVPSTTFSRKVSLCMADEEAAEAEPAPEPTPAPVVSTCISKEAVLAEPNTIEFAKMWDPLGLADLGSDETVAWFRHSEVKHGRICMAAFVGWWVTGMGFRFPGELAYGLDFSSIPSKGLAAWDAVPGWGKVQMLLFIGLIEFHDEIFFSRRGDGKHYLKGGIPGKNMVPGLYDPIGLHKNRSEEAKARGRSAEIKNGRLAMLGVAGLYCAATIDGSVPLQPPC